jgi:hypothetical protein
MSKTKKAAPPAEHGPGTPGWYPRVGELWPGQGIYAGIMRGDPGEPDHHLFIAADPASIKTSVAWGPRDIEVAGAKSERNGAANTAALAACLQEHPAAKWAAGLKIDGHSDWYLPSRRELRLLWVNCAEAFPAGWYWSSTQFSAYYAWHQYFDDGYQDVDDKACQGRARAVRRLVIQ